MKDKTTAYLLSMLGLIGLAGMHRFYLGKFGSGVVYLLTFGFLGFGTLIDWFILGNMVDEYNHGYKKNFSTMKVK